MNVATRNTASVPMRGGSGRERGKRDSQIKTVIIASFATTQIPLIAHKHRSTRSTAAHSDKNEAINHKTQPQNTSTQI
jgi:hypothetical protein